MITVYKAIDGTEHMTTGACQAHERSLDIERKARAWLESQDMIERKVTEYARVIVMWEDQRATVLDNEMDKAA